MGAALGGVAFYALALAGVFHDLWGWVPLAFLAAGAVLGWIAGGLREASYYRRERDKDGPL